GLTGEPALVGQLATQPDVVDAGLVELAGEALTDGLLGGDPRLGGAHLARVQLLDLRGQERADCMHGFVAADLHRLPLHDRPETRRARGHARAYRLPRLPDDHDDRADVESDAPV